MAETVLSPFASNTIKSQGNIIVFRNLKNATDEAITLFSNKEAIEVIIMRPYEDYRAKFDEAFAHHPSTLIKLVRYPGREESADRQGVGAHKDPGVLTLLLVEPGKGGLQVQFGDRWIDAPPLDDAFVVNIGEAMEFATDGYLKATMHRVQSPPPGTERLSVPFFFNPALASTMPKIDLPPALAAQAPGVTEDPSNPISGTFGENMLKARLRAHPDVAARHHADLV